MLKTVGSNSQTGKTYGARGATLKGKLDQLQDMVTELAKEMQFCQEECVKEIEIKNTLENVLCEQTEEVKKTLAVVIQRIKEDFERHLEFQAGENKRFQQELNTLKLQKTQLDQDLIGQLTRVTDIETQIDAGMEQDFY